MQLFDVYPLYDIEPVRAREVYLWDKNGVQYLDFYGGHAVISIGHSHPHYIRKLTEQLERLGFYSNSVQIPLQKELATKLGELSGYHDYQLFLCIFIRFRAGVAEKKLIIVVSRKLAELGRQFLLQWNLHRV